MIDPAEPQRDASTDRRRSRSPARIARRVGIALLIVLIGIGLVLAVLYANRRAAAREIVTSWLERQGIDADVEIQRLEIDGFVGRVRIGDPAHPDLSVETVQVDYALGMPWSAQGMGVTPSRVRLIRPMLRATWKDGKLSLGTLDPLIRKFTGQPPRPDRRGPIVVVEAGRIDLRTDGDTVIILGDAQIDDGKLMRLQARIPGGSMVSAGMGAQGLSGTLNLATVQDRVAISVDLSAKTFDGGSVSGHNARLNGTANLPYPDLKTHEGDGRAVLDLTLRADRLKSEQSTVSDAIAGLAFDGQTQGWIETFRIVGQSSLTLKATTVSVPGLAARHLDIALPSAQSVLTRDARDLRWMLDGPATIRAASASANQARLSQMALRSTRLIAGGHGTAFEMTGPWDLTASRFDFGELSLRRLTGRADLDVSQDGATLITATGTLSSQGGAWPLFGAVKGDDIPELAEMKRALGDFAVDLPSFTVTSGSPGTTVVLKTPARLRPTNGGVLTVSPAPRPLYAAEPGQMGGGSLTLNATRGKGLPALSIAVPDWSLTPGGFQARLDGRAQLDFGLARGIKLTTAGQLVSDRGRLTYQASRCIDFTADRLDLDENDALDLAGRLCPVQTPLVTVQNAAWTVRGILTNVSATVPFLAMGIDQAAGSLAVHGSAAGLDLTADVATSRLQDTTAPARFKAVTASGQARLNADRWTGGFALHSGRHDLGHVTLAHDGLSGIGSAVIATPDLAFAKGGLQPSDLTALVDGIVQPPVTGSVSFDGRFDWNPALANGSSSGRLVIPGLDFASPAGAVKGLKGTIDFTRLTPLVTAPKQSLHVEQLATVAPLTDLNVIFDLDAAALSVAGGEIKAAGGTLRLEPLVLPLTPGAGFGGAIVLDRIQLGDLVAGAGFGDKVSVDAVVSGRLPFTYDPPTGVKVTGGTLAAVQPGRLSIQRQALTGLEAGGGGAVPPSTVEDLAYQAMENLAFQQLDATVNSLEDGRMNLLFHIKGRHDPPQRQDLRLTLPELISRKFLQRKLPLPSDTGIDLTLDTNVNLNQIISDLLAVNRARAGQTLAPETPTPLAPAATPP